MLLGVVFWATILSKRRLMYSPQRTARAPMVDVGFTAPPVVSELPSTINRFGTSQVWLYLLVTESSGVLPILQVPIRCQAGGGLITPVSFVSIAPTALVASKMRSIQSSLPWPLMSPFPGWDSENKVH